MSRKQIISRRSFARKVAGVLQSMAQSEATTYDHTANQDVDMLVIENDTSTSEIVGTSDSDRDSDELNISSRALLRDWALSHNITHLDLNDLLKLITKLGIKDGLRI